MKFTKLCYSLQLNLIFEVHFALIQASTVGSFQMTHLFLASMVVIMVFAFAQFHFSPVHHLNQNQEYLLPFFHLNEAKESHLVMTALIDRIRYPMFSLTNQLQI